VISSETRFLNRSEFMKIGEVLFLLKPANHVAFWQTVAGKISYDEGVVKCHLV